ncbi:MAG: PAS domain S-box protein, partial [Armatimonadota bacterium]
MKDDDRRAIATVAPTVSTTPASGSFRHTLTVAMVLMAVVPALVGGLFLGLNGQALIRAEVLRHMQSVADSVCLDLQHIIQARADATDAFIHRLHIRQTVAVLATGVAESGMGAAQAHELLVEQLAGLAIPSGRREGYAVVVSLPGGRPLAWAGLSAAQAARSAAHHKTDLTKGLGKPWVSPAHMGAGEQIPVVCFIEAIPQSSTGSGPPAAALIWSVALQPTVYATLDALRGLGKSGEIVLVDEKGLVLKDLRSKPNSAFRETLHTEPVERALRGDTSVHTSLDYRGRSVVAATGLVPVTRWGIVVKTDASEAYRGITRLAWLWVALMASLLLIGVATARSLATRLLRPVAALSAATRAVADGDLSATLDTGRRDELGQMARDFDTMAARVASARASLEVALEETRETRDYLDNLLDHARAPIIVWDPAFRITRFNRAFGRLTGRSEESLVGEQVSNLVPQAELDRHMEEIRDATLGQRWDAVEIPIVHVDGSIRTVLWSSAAVYAPDSQTVVATIAQGQDITDRKVAEAALRASEEQYRTLFTNMLNGLASHEIVLDEQGKPVDYRFLEVNDTFEAMLGLKREEVVGRLASAIFPQLQLSWIDTYGQVALTGKVTRFEEYAEGLNRWFEVQAYSPRHGEFITLFDDITERKRAEEALRQSDERFRSIFNEAAVGIAVTALDGTHLDGNQALLDLHGLTREQFLSTKAEEYTHPDDRNADPT